MQDDATSKASCSRYCVVLSWLLSGRCATRIVHYLKHIPSADPLRRVVGRLEGKHASPLPMLALLLVATNTSSSVLAPNVCLPSVQLCSLTASLGTSCAASLLVQVVPLILAVADGELHARVPCRTTGT